MSRIKKYIIRFLQIDELIKNPFNKDSYENRALEYYKKHKILLEENAINEEDYFNFRKLHCEKVYDFVNVD
jgi:protein tyrosine/serine phosphatase